MPKIVDHVAYKQEILNQCFELFARRGYSALTMRQVARELKISTGSLYHYFPSKQAIFTEMLENFSRRDVTEAVSHIPRDAEFDERIDYLFAFVSEREAYFRNMLFLVVDYFRHHEIQTTDFAVKEITNYYKKAIQEHTGAGEESALMTYLFSLFIGLIISRLLDPESVNFKDQARLTKLMVSGLFTGMLGGRAKGA